MKIKNYCLASLVLWGAYSPFSVNSQTWTDVGFPSNGVFNTDQMNGKLYVAQGADIGFLEYDGTTWTTISDYNNSFNTAHKSKSAVRNLNGSLYLGNLDFNTSGEGDFHQFDGTAVSLLQSSDFPYTANYRVNDFEWFNDTVFAGGNFRVPGGAFEYNLVKWNGSDWVRAFPNGLATNAYNVINKMLVYQNELFLLTSNNRTLVYDGQSWDSTRFDYTVGGSTFTSNFTDAVLFNGAFYGCGSFLSVVGGNYVFSNFGKWDGTQLSTLPSPYETINRVGTDGTYLYAIAKDSTGEVYLGRFDGSNWVNYAHLQSPGLGVIPGYELYDYNRIVSYNGELYIGGRFNQIDGNSIQSFAKLSGAPTNLTPLAPTNLQIAVFKTETNYVQLTWTDNSNNETGFIIQRSVANSSSYSNLDTVAANVTTFDDYAIASFTDYYYKVIAFNTSGNSVASNEVTVSIGSVGLTENALEPSVFPNPTTGLLQVKLQSSPKELNLKDLQGRVLAHFQAPSSSLNLDLTSFENGLYLLECVWESNRVSNVRISKQN